MADCGPLQVLRHLLSVAGTARVPGFLIQITANSQDYSCSILLALYILCIVSFPYFKTGLQFLPAPHFGSGRTTIAVMGRGTELAKDIKVALGATMPQTSI